MPISRLDQLTANGFELYTVLEVGLPHFVWRCDLDIEHDRNLHLSEETLLHLIEAGITTREHLGTAMGIDESILRHSLLNLLERHALEYNQAGELRLSTIGKRMLLNAKVRLTSTFENMSVRHDPYKDKLRWHKPEYDLNDKQLRASGRRSISSIKPLGKHQFEERYKEIQGLIEAEGVPGDRSQHKGKREVLRVRPLTPRTVYRPADLEVWYRPATEELSWRILRDGYEEPEVADMLLQLEAEGVQIIPGDEAPTREVVPESNEPLHQLAETITQGTEPNLLKTRELREALKQAIGDAKSALFIVSPWLRLGAIDRELTQTLEHALERNPELKILIGYGIERLPDSPQYTKDVRQYRALKQLESISRRFGGRLKLTEIGNTHEKIIIVDDRYGIIASFNFLSFNPKFERGPGIRREIGFRITQPNDVKELLEYVIGSLQEAEKL